MNLEYVEQGYVDGFRSNLNMEPQQEDVIYLPFVDSEYNYAKAGEFFNLDEIGKSDPKDVVDLVPDTPEGMVGRTRRVGGFKGFNDGKFIDDAATARMLEDPTNKIMAAMMAGKHRKQDSRVRDSFFAKVRTGKDGSGEKAFPTSQFIPCDSRKFLHQEEEVAGSGNLYLTIGKLILARNMLSKGRVKGKRYIAVTSDEISTMLSITPTTSKFYTSVARLEAGEIDNLLGFKFLIDEDLADKKDTPTQRILPCWVDQAMVYRAREIKTATIQPYQTKGYRQHAYYEMEDGAARRYDEGVVGIEVLKP